MATGKVLMHQTGAIPSKHQQIQQNLPKTERDRSGIFFPFSQVSVLQRVVFLIKQSTKNMIA